jgi:hypothetical protein
LFVFFCQENNETSRHGLLWFYDEYIRENLQQINVNNEFLK